MKIKSLIKGIVYFMLFPLMLYAIIKNVRQEQYIRM